MSFIDFNTTGSVIITHEFQYKSSFDAKMDFV